MLIQPTDMTQVDKNLLFPGNQKWLFIQFQVLLEYIIKLIYNSTAI